MTDVMYQRKNIPTAEYLTQNSRVLHKEHESIAHSRVLRGEPKDSSNAKPLNEASLRAVCISGGGIRSATFALGVFNALAANEGKILKKVDYLSTVSGGGYFGGFFGRLFQHYANNDSPSTEEVYQRLANPHSANVSYLKRNGRYLANSGDEALSAGALLLRNALWIYIALYALSIVFFALTRLAVIPTEVLPLPLHETAQMYCAQLKTMNIGCVADNIHATGTVIPFFMFIIVFCVFAFIALSVLYTFPWPHIHRVRRHITNMQSLALMAGSTLAALMAINYFADYLVATEMHSVFSAIGALVIVVATAGYRVYHTLQKHLNAQSLKKAMGMLVAVALLLVFLVISSLLSKYFFKFEWPVWHVIGYALLVLVALSVYMGTCGLINLSSIHFFYAARLRRSFLGAANKSRLGETESASQSGPIFGVSQHHQHDDVALGHYAPDQHGGPLHIINVTLNTTFSPNSQLWQPDRSGASLAVSRFGYLVHPRAGTSVHEWRETESLTVGQWVAISGAAASTGMGQNTHWYLSLITGLLNLRLGYWWQLKPFAMPFFYTQFFRELSSRYADTSSGYCYLSDGGHFENLAAYEMIARKVPRLVILDAGKDDEFHFEDLANLVRLARLDFQCEIAEANDEQRRARFEHHALIGTIEELRSPGSTADQFAKKRTAYLLGNFPDGNTLEILYIKPNIKGDEPADIARYRFDHAEFPHEPTSDQFFDETQWESYRKLGEIAGTELSPLLEEYLS